MIVRRDGLEHRGKDLPAVLQVVDAVAIDDGGAEHHRHLAAELGVGDGVAMGDAPLDPLLGRLGVGDHDGDDGHEREDECDGDPGHGGHCRTIASIAHAIR